MAKTDLRREGHYQASLEALRTLVVAVTKDSSFAILRNDELSTAMVDLKTKVITITDRSIPRGIPQWKAERLLSGLVAHEAGHIKVTMPLHERYQRWIEGKQWKGLAKYINNIYEDMRVNWFIEHRYRYDVGPRLTAYHQIVLPAMVHGTIRKNINLVRLEKSLLCLALLVLADLDVTDYLDSYAQDLTRQAADIMRSALHKRVPRDILAIHDRVYELMKLLMRRAPSKKPKEVIEQNVGEQTLSGDQRTGEEIEPEKHPEYEEKDPEAILKLKGKVTIEEDFIPEEPDPNAPAPDVELDLSDLEIDDKRKHPPPDEGMMGGQGQDEDRDQTEPGDEGEAEDGEGDDAGEEGGDEEGQGRSGKGGQGGKGRGKGSEEGEEREDWDGGTEMNYNRDVDDGQMPINLGGNEQLEADEQSIEEVNDEWEQMQKEAQEKAKQQGKAAMESNGGMSSGSTIGFEIPPLEPNPHVYQRLVSANAKNINLLLNRLKTLQKIQYSTNRFARKGRYMTELHPLFRLLGKSQGKPFDQRFEGTTITMDKLKTKMGLLVDMSWSMNTEDARNALTIIGETAGRWLKSEDFAMIVFGTGYSRIKAFIEPWHLSRYRLGSVSGMGGTNMAEPLHVLIQMLASFRGTGDELLLIIVSDFQVTDSAIRNQELIREAERLGIKVIGVGLCFSDVGMVRQFTKRATYISQVSELSSLFFTLFRASVSGNLR